jgi:Malectin domain
VKKLIALSAFLMMTSLPATAQSQQPIRVNCGGPSYTDSKGQIWQADFGFKGGTATSRSASIAGTPDPQLDETSRVNNTPATPLVYTFAVANGIYHLNLHFAETSGRLEQIGARVFDVKIQGSTVFKNLDVYATAGANLALVEGADIPVNNSSLNVEFENVVGSAKVDAIEILPLVSNEPSLALNFVYPDGTPVAGALAYTITSALLSFKGSVPLSNGKATCLLLTSPSALGINAQFQVALSLTDTAGHTLWQLMLGLNPAEVNLAGIQTSALNVVVHKP